MTSDRFNGSLRLRRKYGMRGYGIYSRIVELILSAPNKRIKYDVDDLVYDMREDAAIIKDVVENFGLFDLVDGYVEDPYAKTPEAIKAELEAKKAAARSEASRKAAATRKAKREAEKAKQNAEICAEPVAPLAVQVQPVSARIDAPVVEETNEPYDDSRDPKSDLFDRVKDLWNRTFDRTHRVVHDLSPDAITWNNFTQSAKTYGLRDFEDAFNAAKKDLRFAWQFKDALKPSNMQRLLSAAEIGRQAEANKRRQNEPELTFEQREMIEYANERGWNWDNT